jgi:predicted ATP-grasp superfamily ATP-dependent carboligase
MKTRVLLAGVSTRAAAESAARAGFAVTAIDAFGDLDQHASVTAVALPGKFTAHAAARAARTIECDAVAYLSNFENYPNAVGTLASGRALWGNTPAVLRRVRDPLLVAQTLARRGFAVPAVLTGEPGPVNPEPGHPWLLKPLASGGGRRVRPWRPGERVPRRCYLQALVDGRPGSVVFVAAGGRAVPLGMSRQLIGEQAFGAAGYQYCGNILMAAEEDEALLENADALSRVMAEEFGLVGVNGIDFIARGSVAFTIEVNPRWSASMELVERAYGLSMFGIHAAACAEGALPEFDLAAARRDVSAFGKAVVFARRDVVVGDTSAWLTRPALPALSEVEGPAHPALSEVEGPALSEVEGPALSEVEGPALSEAEGPALEIRDVPQPGGRIAAGRPVCTVFASGNDSAACHAALVRSAERVYAELATWEREVA